MLDRLRKAVHDRAVHDKEQGFTLVELLVVMSIVGILAAVAIPTFLNQRNSGYRSAITSDLVNAAVAVESWAVDAGGSYAGLTSNVLTTAAGFRGSSNVTVTVAGAAPTATEYCLQGTHSSLGSGQAETFRYLKSVGKPEKGLTC